MQSCPGASADRLPPHHPAVDRDDVPPSRNPRDRSRGTRPPRRNPRPSRAAAGRPTRRSRLLWLLPRMTVAMIRPVAITPGAMQFAVIPNGPRFLGEVAGVVSNGGLRRTIVGVATVGRGCRPGHRTHRDDLPGSLLLHHWGDRIDGVDGPEQVHPDNKLSAESRVRAFVSTGHGLYQH
jgi:hypothetical protein